MWHIGFFYLAQSSSKAGIFEHIRVIYGLDTRSGSDLEIERYHSKCSERPRNHGKVVLCLFVLAYFDSWLCAQSYSRACT